MQNIYSAAEHFQVILNYYWKEAIVRGMKLEVQRLINTGISHGYQRNNVPIDMSHFNQQ